MNKITRKGIVQLLASKVGNRYIIIDLFDVTYSTEEVVLIEKKEAFYRLYCTAPIFKLGGKIISNHEALISIIDDDTVIVEIRLKRGVLYFCFLVLAFVIFMITISVMRDPFAWIFYLPLPPSMLISLYKQKRNFLKFVNNYLANES